MGSIIGFKCTSVIQTFYRCDLGKEVNEDGEEFHNQVILTGDKGTERSWKVCNKCLDLVRDFLLDNAEKNV